MVLPCSPSMVNVGAHNTVDAQRHVGGALSYLSGMGVDGAYNTVGENVGAHNTAWVLSCQGGRGVLFCRCTGYGPRYYGLTYASCLTLSVCFLVLTEWASPVGWSQLALIAPVGKEQ